MNTAFVMIIIPKVSIQNKKKELFTNKEGRTEVWPIFPPPRNTIRRFLLFGLNENCKKNNVHVLYMGATAMGYKVTNKQKSLKPPNIKSDRN